MYIFYFVFLRISPIPDIKFLGKMYIMSEYRKYIELIQKTVDIIRVSLNQVCYIVPQIVILSKYFKIEFYYMVDGLKYYNDSCLLELKKYDLIKIDESNLFYTTIEEFVKDAKSASKTGKRVIYFSNVLREVYGLDISKDKDITDITNITFDCCHGIDEEGFITHRKTNENIVNYAVFRACSFEDKSRKLIEDIYKIDRTKKTILFQDTINTFFHRLDPKDTDLRKIQDKMIDDLIILKEKYNVIIRSHPLYYRSILEKNPAISTRLMENFILDFTQISLYDLYNNADIIISNRTTSSGYQALFKPDTNIIMIDMDHTVRNKARAHRTEYVQKNTNSLIEELMAKKLIIGESHVITGFENKSDLVEMVKQIDDNNFKISDEMKKNRVEFIREKYDIDIDIDIDADTDEKYELLFLMYVLSQTIYGREIFQEMYDMLVEFVPRSTLDKFKINLLNRYGNKIKK